MEENISKLEKMIEEKNALDNYLNDKVYITPSEYQSIKPDISEYDREMRISELEQKKELQEQKINSSFNFLGTINSTASKLLAGASDKCRELISSFGSKEEKKDIQEEIKRDAKELNAHMDEVYKNQESVNNELVISSSSNNELITLPNDVVDNLVNQQLLSLEKDNGKTRKLTKKSNKGSIFSTILLLVVTLSIGITIATIIMTK